MNVFWFFADEHLGFTQAFTATNNGIEYLQAHIFVYIVIWSDKSFEVDLLA